MTERRYVAGPRELALREGRLETVSLGGVSVASSEELRLVLDAARFRHDVEAWRFLRGRHAGFESVDFDDSSWATVPHLHPIYDMHYDGFAAFRTRFVLPAAESGEPVSIVIGGLDDEDWTVYSVYLNGRALDAWKGAGRWREPRRIELAPGDERVRFGGENILAIETRDLDRRPSSLPAGEDEHFFFQGWLLDQFVCTGEPYRIVSDWEPAGVREGETLEVDLRADGLAATISYETGRKRVRIRNEGSRPVRLLDAVLDDLSGPFSAPTKGGRGLPVLAGDLFLGVEHTAGLAQGEDGRLRALVLPGATLAAGETFECPPVIVGVGGIEAFQRYLLELRPRRGTRLMIYDTLGWTDYASEAAERPRLNEELFEQSLTRLEELRREGVAFDVYELDDWWQPDDFLVFNREQYPRGARHLAGRLRGEGMGVALWSATTQSAWTSHAVPGLEESIAGGVARSLGWQSPTDDLAGWDWDAVFAHVSVGQMRYCWAAEPFRGHLRASLARHIADTGATALKLDCTVLHCTSSQHDHMPGRYSVHAIHESVLEVVHSARESSPEELFVIWYWGFQSPWWLAAGDVMFDKALKLEAASPASRPAPTWRAGVTVNSDQAVRHATLLPLSLQDSLGVWLGNVPWSNWMGAEGWQDAFLLDLARGSTLVSLWGDLWLLDADDVELLAGALALARETDFRATVPVGGDPWRFEPYGYAQALAEGMLVTVSNPSFEPRTLALDLPTPLWEVYPSPGTVASAELTLAPWEVRVLRAVDAAALADAPGRESPEPRETRILTLPGTQRLPELGDGDSIVFWARVSRGGAWRYDPEPQALFTLELRMDGGPVEAKVVPSIRSWNGPGCPWVTWSLRADPAWTGRQLEVLLQPALPADYLAETGGLVYDGRALERRRRLAATPALSGPFEPRASR